MPRAFDITTATPALTLDASGLAEVAFTVTNALRQPTRVRAAAEPSGNTRTEWLSVPEAEKDLSPDGTALFTVKLAVPPGTPPGQYSFNLLVVGVTNPDEHYARGPVVAVTVPQAAPVPAKKPFPWWLVALVGGVLLIAGVVVAVLSRGDEKKEGLTFGQPCTKDGPPCGDKLTCGEIGLCLGTEGFQGCSADSQCVGSRCVNNTCVKGTEAGERCEQDSECQSPAKCQERRCRLPDGEACTEEIQCLSGRCGEGKCLALIGPGTRCEEDRDCQSPARCEGNVCRLPDGQSCTTGVQCISGRCAAGTCAEQLAAGGTGCRVNDDCKSPATCIRTRCLLPDRQKCTKDDECLTGRCDNMCLDRADPGDFCDEPSDCRFNAQCKDRRCKLPDRTGPCTNATQCLSGICSAGRCQPRP